MSNNKERDVEQYLVRRVSEAGGIAIKTVSPGLRGFFDRTVVVQGKVVFVETKRPRGGRLSPHQKLMRAEFTQAGAWVETVRNESEVDSLVERLVG
jgi:hypothetical protein